MRRGGLLAPRHYRSLGQPTEGLEATDLQILLSTITDHVRNFHTDDLPPVPVGHTAAEPKAPSMSTPSPPPSVRALRLNVPEESVQREPHRSVVEVMETDY